MNFINGAFKKIVLQHTRRATELPEAAGALGATEVAAGGWFKRNGNRVTPLYGPV